LEEKRGEEGIYRLKLGVKLGVPSVLGKLLDFAVASP
jgi:hypothetical protein